MTLTNYVSGFPFLLVLFTVLIKDQNPRPNVALAHVCFGVPFPFCCSEFSDAMLIKQGTGAQSCRQRRQLGSRCTRANDSKPAQHSLQFMHGSHRHRITEQSRSTESEREGKKKTQLSPLLFTIAGHGQPLARELRPEILIGVAGGEDPFRRHLIGGRGWIRGRRARTRINIRRTTGGRGINQSTSAASSWAHVHSHSTASTVHTGRQAGRQALASTEQEQWNRAQQSPGEHPGS